MFNWITDLYVKHFTKVPLVINYHRWMGAGKDWAGEENFDPDSKTLVGQRLRERLFLTS